MNNKKAMLVLGLVAMVLVCSCGAPRTQQLPVSSKKPERIVSLTPGNTEILFALGAGSRVVGVTDYCNYPQEAKTKPSIGSYYTPDLERVIAAQPDIVFVSGEIHAAETQMLQKAGLRVVPVFASTLQEVLDSIRLIGREIGEADKGNGLAQTLADNWRRVRQLVGQEPVRKVFLEVWDSPLLTVGKKSYINDLVMQAGGVNVAGIADRDYFPCDIEQLYAWQPDTYIVFSHGDMTARLRLGEKTEFNDILAVRSGRIFGMEEDLVVRPGPRSFEALIQLATILHPNGMKSWQ